MFNIANLKIAPVNRVMDLVKNGEVDAVLTILSKIEFNNLSKTDILKESENIPIFDYQYKPGNNFEGIEEYIKSEDWKIVTFEDYEGGETPIELPTERAIAEAISFGVKKLDEGKKTLIHCQMGMSRSPAIAYLILCHYEDPQDAANDLFKIRQGIKPNMFIIDLGDKVMHLNGQAINAMKNKMQVDRAMRGAFKYQFSSSKG